MRVYGSSWVFTVTLALALLTAVKATSWVDDSIMYSSAAAIDLTPAYAQEVLYTGKTEVLVYAPGYFAFEPVGQLLFFQQYGMLYTINEQRDKQALTLPPGTNVKEFALSSNTNRVLLLTVSGEAISVPLAGATTSKNLGLDEYAIVQMYVDPVGGLLYFTTIDQTVYSAQPDGTDVQLLIQLDVACTIHRFIFAFDATVYIPMVCHSQVGVMMCSGSNSTCGIIDLRSYTSSDEFGLIGVFPEIQSFVWAYSRPGGQASAWMTTFSGEGETLHAEETTLASLDGHTLYLMVGESRDYQEEAIALKYCHFSGYFEGGKCRCTMNHYGDQCQTYCSTSGNYRNCQDGTCDTNGQCTCPVGYHVESIGCVINNAPPSKPNVYSTQYQEFLLSDLDGEGTWWSYTSQQSSGATAMRQVDSSVLYLKNYTRGYELLQEGANCVKRTLYGTYPNSLIPPNSLLVANVSCPREDSRECQQWQVSDIEIVYWTTLLNGAAVLWQIEDTSDESNSFVRYYNLDNTSITTVPQGWDDTSGCPCWLSSEDCEDTAATPSSDSLSWLWYVLGIGGFVLVLLLVLVLVGVIIYRRRRSSYPTYGSTTEGNGFDDEFGY